MSERPCELCTRPVGDAKVCVRCRNRFERDLGDVDALDEQLEIVLCRMTAYSDRNGPRSSTRPLPVDLRASEAAWVLRNTLQTWVRVMLEALPQHAHPADTVTAMSTWLLVRAEDVRHHKAAGECMEEIESAVANVRVVIDAPLYRTTFPVGPCPEGDCPGEIRVYISAIEENISRLECTIDLEHKWEPYQWLRAAPRIMRKLDERKAS